MNPTLNERMAAVAYQKSNGSGNVPLIPAQVRDLLNLRRLPAMLTSAQTAALLDCGGEHNIPVLIRARLLEPLGDPAPNAVKYFATVQVSELAGDVERLGRIRDAIYKHWHVKNSTKSNGMYQTSIKNGKRSGKSAGNARKPKNSASPGGE